ncbi:hypothetical protein BV379_15605 [Rhodovulum sulfidophilum]|nr:hypothetical protein BV379_15605 [Rhodovulum sulfidophilum]
MATPGQPDLLHVVNERGQPQPLRTQKRGRQSGHDQAGEAQTLRACRQKSFGGRVDVGQRFARPLPRLARSDRAWGRQRGLDRAQQQVLRGTCCLDAQIPMAEQHPGSCGIEFGDSRKIDAGRGSGPMETGAHVLERIQRQRPGQGQNWSPRKRHRRRRE